MKKILILIFILTGCTKYTDLNNLAIIKSIGVSYNEKYTLYTEIYNEVNKDNNVKTMIIKTNGNTIRECFNNLKKKANKKIFLTHIDLMILDINLKNNNLKEIFNYFINNKEFRNDWEVIISKDTKELLENTKYNEIEDLINNKDEVIKITFEEIMSNYYENGSFNISMFTTRDNYYNIENYQFKNEHWELINEKD